MESKDFYIDLSKHNKKEIKKISKLIIKKGDNILDETLKDLQKGVYTDGFKFLFYSPSGWNQNDYKPNGRKEIDIFIFMSFLKGHIKSYNKQIETLDAKKWQNLIERTKDEN